MLTFTYILSQEQCNVKRFDDANRVTACKRIFFMFVYEVLILNVVEETFIRILESLLATILYTISSISIYNSEKKVREGGQEDHLVSHV